MLSTDEIILKILRKERENGNPILERFKIMYPKENLAEESNYIMVACVSAENNLEGMDFTIYDPYKNNRSGRRGYLGFLPPDSDEMYAIKVNNDLVDAVASKLLVYVKDSSSGGKASKQKNKK